MAHEAKAQSVLADMKDYMDYVLDGLGVGEEAISDEELEEVCGFLFSLASSLYVSTSPGLN